MKWTESKIESKIKAGHGRGTGYEYQSWLKKKEKSSSEGNLSRVKGRLIRRIYELGDKLDRSALILLEQQKNITDIREYYRLDREVTLSIARQLNVKHPCYPDSNISKVLTITFLATYVDPDTGEETYHGVSVLKANELNDPSTLLTLDLTNLATQHELHTKPIAIFTNREYPTEILKGIGFAFDAFEIKSSDFPGINLNRIKKEIIKEVKNKSKVTIQQVSKSIDSRFRYPEGMSLKVFRAMLGHRMILIDFFSEPLSEITSLSRMTLNDNSEEEVWL